MKRLIFAALMLCFTACLVEAQDPIDAPPGDAGPFAIKRMTGIIVDNLCASNQKPEALGDFVKTHTKACALMPACVASGYSLYTSGGKLLKFDNVSNIVVEAFLKEPNNRLDVIVEASIINDELNVVSIENQK